MNATELREAVDRATRLADHAPPVSIALSLAVLADILLSATVEASTSLDVRVVAR